MNIQQLPYYDESIACIKSSIRSIPDYPKTGILFRDVTSLVEDRKAFQLTLNLLYEAYKDQRIDKVAAAEARGFVFGAALADRLRCGLALVRKPGKLPREIIAEDYDLEYGQNTLQVHVDAVKKGERVLIVDDLIATAGTVCAMIRLMRKLEAEIVGAAFVIELFDLGGVSKIKNEHHVECLSLVKFPGH